jgi:hypothetical protein
MSNDNQINVKLNFPPSGISLTSLQKDQLSGPFSRYARAYLDRKKNESDLTRFLNQHEPWDRKVRASYTQTSLRELNVARENLKRAAALSGVSDTIVSQLKKSIHTSLVQGYQLGMLGQLDSSVHSGADPSASDITQKYATRVRAIQLNKANGYQTRRTKLHPGWKGWYASPNRAKKITQPQDLQHGLRRPGLTGLQSRLLPSPFFDVKRGPNVGILNKVHWGRMGVAAGLIASGVALWQVYQGKHTVPSKNK